MPTISDCVKCGCPAGGCGAVKCANEKECPLKKKEQKNG